MTLRSRFGRGREHRGEVDPGGDEDVDEVTASRVGPATEKAQVSIEIGRVFDVPEAWLARDQIQRTPAGTRVILDFHRTSELHDFALAVLIEALSHASRKVQIRGLGRHHRSLLKLLGRSVEALAGSADPEAAALAAGVDPTQEG